MPILKILFFIFITLFPSLSYSQTITGIEILKKNRDLQLGYSTEIIQGDLNLYNPDSKRIGQRSFEMKRLENNTDKKESALIIILSPTDLKGTKLLSIISKNGSRQWIYLPSLKQKKEILASNKGGRFLGSDFSFEDLLPSPGLGNKIFLEGEESWDGKPCYQVKIIDSTSSYASQVRWIDKNNFRLLRIDYYNDKGEKSKTALFENYQATKGFDRPMKIHMKDELKGYSSELLIRQISVGLPLSNQEFTPLQLTAP